MARILVANDNPDLVELCQSLLEHDGHVVETLTNGARVLELTRTWRPDLVLLDWVMPKMDGGAATRALRAQASTASIPILMMSGSADGEAQARDAGADAFLCKPFRPSDLLRHVADLLQVTARDPSHRRSSESPLSWLRGRRPSGRSKRPS